MRSLVIWHTHHYLPPDTGDSHAFTPVLTYRPWGDERWVTVKLSTVSEQLAQNCYATISQVLTVQSQRPTEYAAVCERLAQGRYLAADRPRLEPTTFRSLIRRSSLYSTRPQTSKQAFHSQVIRYFFGDMPIMATIWCNATSVLTIGLPGRPLIIIAHSAGAPELEAPRGRKEPPPAASLSRICPPRICPPPNTTEAPCLIFKKKITVHFPTQYNALCTVHTYGMRVCKTCWNEIRILNK